MIHDLLIHQFKIKKILWSHDFDFADFCDLMILILMNLVIQIKKTHDPMILKWRKLMILWSQNENNQWSRDLKIDKKMILWSENQ